MMKLRILSALTIFLSILTAQPLFSVNFSELNLSQDNRLLFKAEYESQNAVFISPLAANTAETGTTQYAIQQLTAFPERIKLVDNGRSIFVQNRFGVSRIPTAGGLPVSIPGCPSFSEGFMPSKGRLQEVSASNDGRWIVYIEPTSPAYGTLFIVNTVNGTKKIVTEKIELPAKDFPVKWSPDSRLFVYVKDSNLYYFPIISDLSVLIDERFRLIGSGSINSVVWNQQGALFYFCGNTLYSVRNPELFTRTIYGDFLSIGRVLITTPFEFDYNFDSYWVSPDSSALLVNKNDKGMFLFLLGENTVYISLLHFPIQDGAENLTVLWPSPKDARILYSVKNKVIAAHLEINETLIKSSHLSDVPSSAKGYLSPNGSRVIFWGEQGLELWDFSNWRLIQKLFNEPILSCAWISNDRFVVGNARYISEVIISNSNATQKRICLSGAEQIAYETTARGQSRVLAKIGGEWFATDTRTAWTPVNEPQLRQVSYATDRFRVFLESNILMIRNLQAISTTPFLSKHTVSRAYPQKNSQKIALCFDLYDDDTGLYKVLAALKRNGIKATFFLNGEFIRRNPASALAITEAGHETGSMFYAPIDLADARFRITREFIVQGLARNEDEFFSVTGKELGSLWHPPFYRTSELITSAAASANYKYIPPTLDLRDWMSSAESARLNIRQVSPSQMIEQIIMQGRNEAVIPIRLGLLPGGRDEYLFQRIDVLLDALVRSGIEVVPVSQIR